MPSASARSGPPKKQPVQPDTLLNKAAAAASGLLDENERVLVVYDEAGATLYYESSTAGDGLGRRKVPRVS